jgi:hypothetical protein
MSPTLNGLDSRPLVAAARLVAALDLVRSPGPRERDSLTALLSGGESTGYREVPTLRPSLAMPTTLRSIESVSSGSRRTCGALVLIVRWTASWTRSTGLCGWKPTCGTATGSSVVASEAYLRRSRDEEEPKPVS